MTTFAFESISAGEAAAFSAADQLTVNTPGHAGAQATVLFQADGGVSVTMAGRTLAFGAGLVGGTATFADGSRLYVGTVGGDTVAGAANGDGLYGGQGDDSLVGAAGDDLLQGNQGRDQLAGGPGADVIYGGQGDDVIDVGEDRNFGQGNLGNDVVRAAAGAGRNTLLGGQGDDTIGGGGDADLLNGNLGSDRLDGGAGGDTLLGEGGADTIVAAAGSSFAAAMGSFAGEIVDTVLGWTIEDRIDHPGGPLPTPGRPGIDPATYYEVSVQTTIADADYYGPFGPPTPFDFFKARDECVRLMTQNPTLDVIAVESYEDVLVFIDADDGNAPDLVIRLAGVTLDQVGFDNFI